VQQQAERVVIGMDTHKRSATIEVMTADESVIGGGRYATDEAGFAAMADYVNTLRPAVEDRVWAVEGCNGIGHHIAMRLLAAGERVVDVPPKLSARARVFATGQGRKTDATDAHSVALVGTRMAGLRSVVNDEQLAVLRVLVDRRRSLGEDHTRMVSQLHHLMLELIPGGAKKDLSAAQAKALMAKVRSRDLAGKTRRRAGRRPRKDLRAQEGSRPGAARARGHDRHQPAAPERDRAVWRRQAAGRGRRHHPVARPRPLRVLERHRTHRRILRRPGPTPAVTSREPTDQPDPAHHGHRPAAQSDQGRDY
jgi:Transposase